MLKGVGASQGYGIGKAVVIEDSDFDYSSIEYSNAQTEKQKLNDAVQAYVKKTEDSVEKLKAVAGDKEAEILQGHLIMLQDPFMLSQMEDGINNGSTAESAVDSVCNMFIDMFSSTDDELVQQRATDVKDIKNNLLAIMLKKKTVDISKVEKNSVLIAKDLTPSMTSQINSENVCAIVTEVGGVTSHSAILARAMGIPAVLSVIGAVDKISDGETLVVDGFKGKVIISPSERELGQYHNKQQEYLKEKESLNEYFSKPTVTKSGIKKAVYANISKAEDAQNVIQNGGEGVGLFRTEFLFMDRSTAPSEEEQYEAYSTVAKAMDGKEVIIRTLDVGGDKAIDYLKIPKEENPFLGYRAIRYCLDNPNIFKVQLRAILRASVYGNIKIMLPMITNLDEVRRAKGLINECKAELDKQGYAYKNVSVGVMIETPAAVLISDLLAKEVDFFSIGTNDLTGYTMAVDRGNASVSRLYDANQTAVLRAIEMTVKNAKSAGITVGMCGEAASDFNLIPQLVEWGLDEFSVSPSSILQTRKYICNCQ